MNVAVRYRFAMLQENNSDLLRKIMDSANQNPSIVVNFISKYKNFIPLE